MRVAKVGTRSDAFCGQETDAFGWFTPRAARSPAPGVADVGEVRQLKRPLPCLVGRVEVAMKLA